MVLVDDQTAAVSVDARPSPIDVDPRDTAIIVVDMQHGFGGDGGWWDRAGVDVSGIQAAVAPISSVLTIARRTGMLVVYLTMDLEGADERRSPRLMRYFEHVRRDTTETRERTPGMRESDILPEIAPEVGDVIVDKPRHSGFFNTGLDETLKQRSITTLVFTGCTTSVCVESTLRDAFFRDYRCLLLEDCVAEPLGPDNHRATLTLVEFLYGWIGRSTDLEAAFSEVMTASAAP